MPGIKVVIFTKNITLIPGIFFGNYFEILEKSMFFDMKIVKAKKSVIINIVYLCLYGCNYVLFCTLEEAHFTYDVIKKGYRMKQTLQEKIEKIKDLRPIDDVFFEALAQNVEVCQEILRVILEDKALIVESVITQSSEQNIYGRSVRLDALCTLGNGTKCNIEVQRSNKDNHLKRVRFNASSITVKESDTGSKFEDILELYIVYISEFDFLKGNKTIYHVDKVVRETGMVIDDGLHEIYVNTVVDDGTDISELMSCFIKKEVKNPKFPALSSEVQRLKENEGGAIAMSEIMEKYEKIAADNAVHKERIDKIQKMIKAGCEKSFILELDYTEEEYEEAKRTLSDND